MERRLLFSQFKYETTMAEVQDKIGGTLGNLSAHRASAFKLGLRTALDVKKRSAQATTDSVTLQC